MRLEYGRVSQMRVQGGIGFTIEVKIKDKIRGYHYSNPRVYLNEYPDVVELKNFIKILDLLNGLIN